MSPREASGRKPRTRLFVIGVAGGTDWVGWVERFAAAHGVNRQELIAGSLVETARLTGFEPPPDRVPRKAFRLRKRTDAPAAR